MAINEVEIQEQLKDAGNRLLNPMSSTDELLNHLDKLERLLIYVEQAPSRSMQDALLPPMKALISGSLLRHSDSVVKVSVASCLSEITRITAPDAPYNDNQMKEIFQLIVAAFEKLSYVSGHSYAKAVSILDTMAKVRSCLVMLDLELHELTVEMFQKFLKTIRPNHPNNVLLAMETIMTWVIEESEDISMDLIAPLLASARKESQSASPIAWKLGEKVLTNCFTKLKPYLKEAVRSLGVALDEYTPIVDSICQDESHPLKHDHVNHSEKHLMIKGSSPDDTCLGENFQAVDGISNSTGRVVTASTGKVNTFANDNSSSMLKRGSLAQDFITEGGGYAEPVVKLGVKPQTSSKKRGRKPNSLMNPEEGYDHSWVRSGRKTYKIPQEGKIDATSPSGNLVLKKAALSSLHISGAEPASVRPKTSGIGASSSLSKQSSLEESLSKRGRKRKGKFVNEPGSMSLSMGEILSSLGGEKSPKSGNVILGKQSKERTEVKRRKFSREAGDSAKNVERISLTPGHIAPVVKSEEEKPDSVDVQLKSKSKGSLSVQKRNTTRMYVNDASHGDTAETLDKITKSSNRDGNLPDETPKTLIRRKRTPRKEMDSGSLAQASVEQLIGCKIKVWWPLDKTYYEGVVHSYDPIRKKHRVLYTDGDEETLNLKREDWELMEGHVLLDQGFKIGIPKPDESSFINGKGKRKLKPKSPKQPKSDASSKRNRAASFAKLKTQNSYGNHVHGPKRVKSRSDTDSRAADKMKMRRLAINQIKQETMECDDFSFKENEPRGVQG